MGAMSRWWYGISSRGQLGRIVRNWNKRPELQKPETETELPESNLPESEEAAAIRRERERRVEGGRNN
jgi:hypothetical protein